jgi:DNA-directed RNA polymerase subunit F
MVEQSILEMIGMASMSPSIKKLTDDTSKAKAMHKRIAGILVSRMPVKLHEMNEINRFLLDDADSALEFIFNSAKVEGIALTDEIVDAIVDIVARLQTSEEQLQGLHGILNGLEVKRT